MSIPKIGAALLLLLILSGCGDSEVSSADQGASLSLAALFQTESGEPLQGGAAQFSLEDSGETGLLDSSGAVSVSGIPRSGELLLTLFDQRQQVQGTMTLSFSEGAVIDAVTDEDGVGHITIRNDTDEVALTFVLEEDGALRCTLWLTKDALPHADKLRKEA